MMTKSNICVKYSFKNTSSIDPPKELIMFLMDSAIISLGPEGVWIKGLSEKRGENGKHS